MTKTAPPKTGRSAIFVATGILLSRLAGLFRQTLFNHYFGLSAPAGAFTAAIRIPNFLNNLFGEGALSASFIPVYASLVARGEQKEADRVAGAIASVLALGVSALVLLGVLATPVFLDVIAPGFKGSTRDLTIVLVRILFPSAGLMVMSAWCLGVLNSHHRFLVSYTAPVVWNAAMIGTLIVFGREASLPRLATVLAWGSVLGSFLMFAVQLPIVLKLAPALRLGLDTTSQHVRTVAPKFRSCICQPWRRAAERIYRYVPGVVSWPDRGGGDDERANDRVTAGQSLRDVGIGGRASCDVRRSRRGSGRYGRIAKTIECGTTPNCLFRHSISGGISCNR